MHPEPNTPPPLPAAPPPLPVSPPSVPLASSKKKTQPWVIAIILGAVLLMGIAIVGIVAAILIPTVGKVRETARRTVDQSNLRQVVQAALIYSFEHDGRLPGRSIARDGRADGTRELATIHTVAAALARDGGLSDGAAWFSQEDQPGEFMAPVLSEGEALNTEFTQRRVVAWDFATGLSISHPATTPVAWTRGLRRDGTWDPKAGVYGDDGGHIAFLGGNVQFFPDLSKAPLLTPDGSPTSDILQALPAGTRVVGAGPGTLHGAEGGAK